MPDILRQAKKDERNSKKKLSKAKKLFKKAKARVDRIVERRKEIDDRSCLDGCTLPLGLKLVLVHCREKGGWDGVVDSADRTKHADDCGNKMSQAELWAAFQNGTGNPANPPGTGSHEFINGGNGGSPAYSNERVGAKLAWWQLGLDLSDDQGFVKACDKLGYRVFRPHMPREPWHFNFRDNPKSQLIRNGVI